MNMLRRGSVWLEQMRNEHLTEPVAYDRDGDVVTVNATYGRTEYEVASESGLTVGAHAWDFLIAADALGFEPEPGDTIEANGVRYEVMALGDDVKGWRWSDPYRQTYRIHTRQVSTT